MEGGRYLSYHSADFEDCDAVSILFQDISCFHVHFIAAACSSMYGLSLVFAPSDVEVRKSRSQKCDAGLAKHPRAGFIRTNERESSSFAEGAPRAFVDRP